MPPKAPRSGRGPKAAIAPAVARRLACFASASERAIFVGNADGKLEWANDAACQLCGISLAELLGRHLQLFPDDPEAQRRADDHIRERFAVGAHARVEAAIRNREGRPLWIDLEVVPVPAEPNGADSPRGLDGWVAIATDVSERKRAEAELIESEARYRQMVDVSPRAVAVHSGGTIVYVNRAGLELIGATLDGELIGRSIFDFLHPDFHKVVAERIMKMETVGDPADRLREQILRIDGAKVDVEIEATPIVWRGQPAVQFSADPIPAAGVLQPRAERPAGVDLSVLVLGLAQRIEDRIAPWARVSFDLRGGLPPISGEKAELEALAVMVVAQATAALPGGCGRIAISTALRTPADWEAPHSWITLEVEHDGPGLESRARASVFEAGFTRRFPRCGPGLGDARSIARRHGGSLRLEGSEGETQRIVVRLPATDAPLQAEPAAL